MAGWHHQCNRHELGQTSGDGGVREAWCAAVHGVARVGHDLGTKLWQILKEINPEFSLKGLMVKLKLQYFGHLM